VSTAPNAADWGYCSSLGIRFSFRTGLWSRIKIKPDIIWLLLFYYKLYKLAIFHLLHLFNLETE